MSKMHTPIINLSTHVFPKAKPITLAVEKVVVEIQLVDVSILIEKISMKGGSHPVLNALLQ